MVITLTNLPREIILLILSHLSVADLLQCSRICHTMRSLCFDPVLHKGRRQRAIFNLQLELSRRKTRAEISPPMRWVYLTNTFVLSRSIDRSLVKIRLSHNLGKRPRVEELVTRSIFPSWYAVVSPSLIPAQRELHRCKIRIELSHKLNQRPDLQELVQLNILPGECLNGTISSRLIATRRRVLKETLKDGLRSWIERGIKARQDQGIEEEQSHHVKSVVRWLTARCLALQLEMRFDRSAMQIKNSQSRYGRALQHKITREKQDFRGVSAPARANVLALTRFWEQLNPSTGL